LGRNKNKKTDQKKNLKKKTAIWGKNREEIKATTEVQEGKTTSVLGGGKTGDGNVAARKVCEQGRHYIHCKRGGKRGTEGVTLPAKRNRRGDELNKNLNKERDEGGQGRGKNAGVMQKNQPERGGVNPKGRR